MSVSWTNATLNKTQGVASVIVQIPLWGRIRTWNGKKMCILCEIQFNRTTLQSGRRGFRIPGEHIVSSQHNHFTTQPKSKVIQWQVRLLTCPRTLSGVARSPTEKSDPERRICALTMVFLVWNSACMVSIYACKGSNAYHVWSHWSAIACKGTLINNAMYGPRQQTGVPFTCLGSYTPLPI